VSRRVSAPRSPGALHHDPLAEEQILERFYRPERPAAAIAPTAEDLELAGARGLAGHDPIARKPKPAHYKIVCISLYNDDIERLEKMVETLKRRGHTKANKSQLIRAALDQVDLDKVPKSH
jgi:hypothetical protein